MRYKAFASVIVAILLMIPVLTACYTIGDVEMNMETEPPSETVYAAGAPSETAEYISTEALTAYTIVYPEQASKAMTYASTHLCNKVLERFGVELDLEKDLLSENELMLNPPRF